jgi:hypothetical protein
MIQTDSFVLILFSDNPDSGRAYKVQGIFRTLEEAQRHRSTKAAEIWEWNLDSQKHEPAAAYMYAGTPDEGWIYFGRYARNR